MAHPSWGYSVVPLCVLPRFALLSTTGPVGLHFVCLSGNVKREKQKVDIVNY